jgi:tRNA(Ile)-lysidine synthase
VNIADPIRDAIRRHGLIPDGAKVVAGISGGADSVALLRVFHTLEIPCTVAHMNHQLRGKESDDDEQFVRALADELRFPMVGKSVNVRQLAKETGQSIEMAARRARHAFFAGFDNSVIALAHHADDQVETFLLKLARGAGAEGLCGMPYFQSLENLSIIRPMLDVPRTGIIQWMEKNGFTWRDDASNADEAFLRNRVRHTILPMLERELNPNIRETILRTMDILREEDAWMDGLLEKAAIDAPQPLAAKRRILRKWLFDQGAGEVSFDAVEQILAQMAAGSGTTVFELNNRQRVVVEYGKPRFEEAGFQPLETAWTLVIEPGTGWRRDHGQGAGILPAEASFDSDKVGDSPLEVRGAMPGDRIEPLGMEGGRKLQDILTDQKVPRAQRAQIPVVVCRGEIIWVPGYRTARGWEVKNGGKAVHVRIEQNRTD